MNAGGAAVLNPVDKFVERHFISELERFGALVKRDDAVPRIANESEFEVGLKLFATDFSPALFRKQQIQRRENPVFSSAVTRPIRLHLVLDLPQIQMRFPRFAQNSPDTGRARLGHFYENALMFVRDHCPAAMKYENDEMMDRPGLEPGTNPESFRGCSLFSRLLCFIQCENRQLWVLFALELAFKCARFAHRRHLFRRRKREVSAETMRCVIASTPVLSNPPVEIFGGTDVVSATAAQNIDPRHTTGNDGSAGTRTRNQRLKRALLYRLSYRPVPETFSNPDRALSQDL